MMFGLFKNNQPEQSKSTKVIEEEKGLITKNHDQGDDDDDEVEGE